MKIDLYSCLMFVAVGVFVFFLFVAPFFNEVKEKTQEEKTKERYLNMKKEDCPSCKDGIVVYNENDDLVKLGVVKVGDSDTCPYCQGVGYLYVE